MENEGKFSSVVQQDFIRRMTDNRKGNAKENKEREEAERDTMRGEVG